MSKKSENPQYLSSQLITYLGNKRSLLSEIEKEILEIKKSLNKEKLKCADLFSGSGCVARMLKQHSSVLFVNDLEAYSQVINSCYLTNFSDFDEALYDSLKEQIESECKKKKIEGIISKNYAPEDDLNIKPGERVFYTRQNALLIDTYRSLIDRLVPLEMQKFFLAPLLSQASVHVNTSGVFKGFYKDKNTGIGCFGASKGDALNRILGKVELVKPVFSNFESKVKIYKEDTVLLSKELSPVDVVYLDPPYNQHPYGSNYFMLNLILKNKLDVEISRVSGITQDWNRSVFNVSAKAFGSLETIVSQLKAKYIIISYNSEGYIKFDEMKAMLLKYGKVKTVDILYNTFRGSRNLANRKIHVKEYLFVLEKE